MGINVDFKMLPMKAHYFLYNAGNVFELYANVPSFQFDDTVRFQELDAYNRLCKCMHANWAFRHLLLVQFTPYCQYWA